jgi:putative spermidine/putrescine transport system substrate-binding protein/spermidine/putrescine transport system substrate-binding protein
MKKIRQPSRRDVVAGIAAASTAIAAPGIVRAQSSELRVFAWEGYAEPEWVEPFEQATGARANIVYASSVDEMFARMQGSQGQDFDVLIFDTSLFDRYRAGNLIQTADPNRLGNYGNLAPEFQQVDGLWEGEDRTYGIPFAWGSLPLIYDADAFPTPPESWEVMWDPAYAQQVIAVDDANNQIVVAALVLGLPDPYNLSDAEFQQVKEKLIAQKGQLLTYYAGFDDGVSIFAQNNIKLMLSMGELQLRALREMGVNAALTIPREKAIGWLDCWVISGGARDLDLAHAWLDQCIAEPIGKVVTEKAGYGNTTNLAANTEAGLTYADRLSWLQASEDYEKRLAIWNEVKAS